MTTTTNNVALTDIQFAGNTPTDDKLRRLVADIQKIERAINALIAAASSSSTDSSTLPHVLATTTGLNSDHTVTGLTPGMVLKAISAVNAAFAKLKFSELVGSDITDTPDEGDSIQFIDGYWIAAPTSGGGGSASGINVGGGVGIYESVAASVLQFKSLVSSGAINIVDHTTSVSLDFNHLQATAALDTFTTVLKGLVPAPGAVNNYFLRDDGTFQPIVSLAVPPIGAGWTTSDGVTAILLPIGAVTRLVAGAYTLKGVEILTQGGTGSCVVNIWKANRSAHYPPVSGDDITGGVPPSISSGTTYTNTTLTGWTTAIAAEDVFLFTLTSTTNFTAVQISLEIG